MRYHAFVTVKERQLIHRAIALSCTVSRVESKTCAHSQGDDCRPIWVIHCISTLNLSIRLTEEDSNPLMQDFLHTEGGTRPQKKRLRAAVVNEHDVLPDLAYGARIDCRHVAARHTTIGTLFVAKIHPLQAPNDNDHSFLISTSSTPSCTAVPRLA